MASLISSLEQQQVTPSAEINSQLEAFESAPLRNQATLAQLLRRPEISLAQIRSMRPEIPQFAQHVDAQAEIQIKYAGYVSRQMDIVERFQKMEHVRLPDDIDYSQISGLSHEVCEKRIESATFAGQASRISGITPAAITLLSFTSKKKAPRRRRPPQE